MNFDLTLKRPQSFPQHGHDVCTAVEIHGRSDLHHQADFIPATISLLPLGSPLASNKSTFRGAQLIRSARPGGCANKDSKSSANRRVWETTPRVFLQPISAI